MPPWSKFRSWFGSCPEYHQLPILRCLQRPVFPELPLDCRSWCFQAGWFAMSPLSRMTLSLWTEFLSGSMLFRAVCWWFLD